VLETTWHPSQVTEKLKDGRVRLRLTVASTIEIRHWILGWGQEVEVVKPAHLREEMMEIARAMSRLYEPVEEAFKRLVTRAG